MTPVQQRERRRLADPVGLVGDAEGEGDHFQTLTFALVLRFAGTDDGNAAGATASGL